MFITVRLGKITKYAIITVLIAAAIGAAVYVIPAEQKAAFNPYSEYTLVIDAGHGGIDGGAVSDDGHKESDINLSIALKMSALCDFIGMDNALIRTGDAVEQQSDYSERSNLLSRAEFANSVENAVLISIHQNTFPSSTVKGAEVMYAKTQGSRELGLSAQEKLVLYADPENRRVARPAPDELLLTASVKCPAILVECGFLSNSDEAALLCSDAYQTKIATALISAYIDFSRNKLTL